GSSASSTHRAPTPRPLSTARPTAWSPTRSCRSPKANDAGTRVQPTHPSTSLEKTVYRSIPSGPATRRLTLVGGLAAPAPLAAACGDAAAGSGSSAGAPASGTGGAAYGGYAPPAPAAGSAAGS